MYKKFLPTVLCFILICSVFAIPSFGAAEDGYGALGIKGGDYYYLKNLNTSLYLTTNLSNQVVQSLFAGNSSQQFGLDYVGNGYYQIKPAASSAMVLGVDSSSGNTNGAYVNIMTNSSATNQQWYFTRNSNGSYRAYIRSISNTKALSVENDSFSSGAKINIWTYKTTKSDWILEPARSGDARYCLVANDVTSSGMTAVNSVRNSFSNLGYGNNYSYLPTPSNIYTYFPMNKIFVIHGHGDKGYTICTQTNGSAYYLYSSNINPGTNNKSISQFSYNELARNQFVMFISCYSGAAPSGGKSMADAVYEKGASTVMAFINTVAAGEFYADYLFSYLSSGYELEDAIDGANYDFTLTQSPSWVSSPANGANRTV